MFESYFRMLAVILFQIFDYTKLNLYNLKLAAYRDLRQMKTKLPWQSCVTLPPTCRIRTSSASWTAQGSYTSSSHIYWSLLYSAILCSWADSLCSHVILHEWIAFYSAFLNIHWSGVPTALTWLVPQESAARESQSRHVLCTPYNHAPCHFMQSHIRKVYACLVATCHLRFWQNDRGLLCATAVTRGVERIPK